VWPRAAVAAITAMPGDFLLFAPRTRTRPLGARAAESLCDELVETAHVGNEARTQRIKYAAIRLERRLERSADRS